MLGPGPIGDSVTDFLSHRVIGRLAGLLYLCGSIIFVATAFLPHRGGSKVALLGVTAGSIVAGLFALFAPWQRWQRSATLVLVFPALALIAAGNVVQYDPWTYGLYYLITAAWVGVAHPRGTTLKILPLALASYLAPGVWVNMSARGYQSTVMAMASFLIVGESLAWVSTRSREAETVDIGRMRAMEALVQATVALAAADEPAAAADRVAELARELLDGRGSIVLLADPAGGLRGAGACRWPVPASEVHVRWLDLPARQSMNDGTVTGHPGQPLAGDLTHAAGGQPVVFLPLRGSAQPLGLVMVVMETEAETRLDHFDNGLAATFATQAGLAFERLEATKVLFEASMRDALTGIGNRRQADQSLGLVAPGDAVAILDLDHFKAVNDRYGHPAGDRVLSTLATFLERFLREGDSVARYGGEEFVVILRGVDAQAQSAFDRIAEDWRASGPVTTFSAGVAVHRAGRSPSATLTLADQALYEAKAAGRNRVIMATEPTDADIEVRAGT